MSSANWFDVDRVGLAQLLAGRDKAFVLYELLQNAWDQNVTEVHVTIRTIPRRSASEIVIEDNDPEGFAELAHAYTLFAESRKKGHPEQRGRFNIGEKLVLALAHEAAICTTQGCVRFDAQGRHASQERRPAGSSIRVEIPLTRSEHEALCQAAFRVIPPAGVTTTVNGCSLPQRVPVGQFEAVLPTVASDANGTLRATSRKTTVRIHEPVANETATLYELGLPVVPTGDRFHIDVQQKIPLNMNRDNVTPAYLRTIRVAVLNATHDRLTTEDAAQTWVKEACGDERVEDQAVRQTVKLRFGERAVSYDPTDPEANKRSAAEGRPLVYGGHLSAAEWGMVRRARALSPAGQVTPSPKPFGAGGRELTLVAPADWTPGMRHTVAYAKCLARALLGCDIEVRIAREFGWNYCATYGPGQLTFNLARCRQTLFEGGISDELNELLIHEFGHHYSGDHLSADYYDGLCRLGAKLLRLALEQPALFRKERWAKGGHDERA